MQREATLPEGPEKEESLVGGSDAFPSPAAQAPLRGAAWSRTPHGEGPILSKLDTKLSGAATP